MSRTYDLSNSLDPAVRDPLLTVTAVLDGLFGPGRYVLIGAFARDLLLTGRAGNNVLRATNDVDVSLEMSSSDEFEHELAAVSDRGSVLTRRQVSGYPVDFLPFGAIAPTGSFEGDGLEYDVRGLEEAYRHADLYELDANRVVKAPPLSIMVGLKLIAWGIRHKAGDADDLGALLDATAYPPFDEDIWSAGDEGADLHDFDPALAGPYVHGRNLATEYFTFRTLSRCLEIFDSNLDRLSAQTPRRNDSTTRLRQYEMLRAGLKG